MKNIFDNAYFGKQYKTRDGRKMIYLMPCPEGEMHKLLDEDINIEHFHKNGQYAELYPLPCDIISEWTINKERQVVCWNNLSEEEKSNVMLDIVSSRKPIDEEELDGMAWCKAIEEYIDDYREPYAEGFKAGFKAREAMV